MNQVDWLVAQCRDSLGEVANGIEVLRPAAVNVDGAIRDLKRIEAVEETAIACVGSREEQRNDLHVSAHVLEHRQQHFLDAAEIDRRGKQRDAHQDAGAPVMRFTAPFANLRVPTSKGHDAGRSVNSHQ